MAHTLPDLPYGGDALEPHISAETIGYHYGKHHQSYVNSLNELVSGTDFEGKSLEQVIRSASGAIFNNAAQVWNHTFYWHSLSPNGGGTPSGQLAAAIDRDFGSFESFSRKFSKTAIATFGSGWTWLVQEPGGGLSVVSTANAETPLTGDSRPLLTCDVWEHAYYIDYRNARPDYVEAFWKLVDWEFAASRLRT